MTSTPITFPTPAPVAATVQVARARVRVVASDRTDTVVRVEPADPTSRSDVTAAERATVEFVDGRLTVKTAVSAFLAGEVAVTVDLPAGSALVTDLAQSDIDVDGPLGECELSLSTGRVRLDRVDALRANVATGEVTVGRIAGPAEIDGGTAAVRIGEVDGAVRIYGSGGSTWIGHARGGLDLGSAGGGFDIDLADAGVTATTAGGAIRIGRMTRGRARLTNGSGDIEIGIGAGTVVSVDARSTTGAVHDLVSSQANFEQTNPDQAGPTVMVHARTRHGDIVVQRAA